MPVTNNTGKFSYSPRIADVWRALDTLVKELPEEDRQLFMEIHDAVSILEMRDKQLEDFITPQYRSKAKGFNGAIQTVPHATYYRMDFDAVEYDVTQNFGTIAPYNTYKAPVTGFYLVSAHSEWASGFTAPNKQGVLYVNGGQYARGTFSGAGAEIVNTTVFLNQSDLMDFRVYQDSGVSQNTLGNFGGSSYFSVHILSTQVYS